MICEYTAKTYCKDKISEIKNYDKAIIDSNQMWDCHHIKGTIVSKKELIENGEYFNRPASELIFLTKAEHMALHKKGNKNMLGKHHTQEAKIKLSEANKGKKRSEETKIKLAVLSKGNKNMLGKHHSPEAKIKMSESHKGTCHTEEAKRKIGAAFKGLHWFNNGSINVRAKSCPDGFVKGRLKRN